MSRRERAQRTLERETHLALIRYAVKQGYGWEDLILRFGILPSVARNLVGLHAEVPGEEE